MKLKRILSTLTVLALTLSLCIGAFPTSVQAGSALPSSYTRNRYRERKVECTSGENTLKGTLTMPRNATKDVPVAILIHGLNSTQTWCADIARYLAVNGIASVRFDLSGYGKSDGEHEDMTVSSRKEDVLAIVEYVKGLYFTDPDNIFLVGKSMGAVDAVLAAEECAEDIKALCLWYPFFDLNTNVEENSMLGVDVDFSNPPATVEISGNTYGRQFFVEIRELDLEAAYETFEGPVLILHGDEDESCDISASIAAQKVMKNCTLITVPGGGHGFTGQNERNALHDMLTFMLETLAETSKASAQSKK